MIIVLSLAHCQGIICIVLGGGRMPKSCLKCKPGGASQSDFGYKWIRALEGLIFIISVTPILLTVRRTEYS